METGKNHLCPDPDDPKNIKVRLFLHPYIKTADPCVVVLSLKMISYAFCLLLFGLNKLKLPNLLPVERLESNS